MNSCRGRSYLGLISYNQLVLWSTGALSDITCYRFIVEPEPLTLHLDDPSF